MPAARKREPTLFDVLSLSPTALDGQDGPAATKVVRQAYRRALLRHHPDKSQQQQAAAQREEEEAAAAEKGGEDSKSDDASASSSPSPPPVQKPGAAGPESGSAAARSVAERREVTVTEEQHYTVDEITHAYTVLSDARQRREYVRALRSGGGGATWVQSSSTTSSSSSAPRQNWTYSHTFHFSTPPSSKAAHGSGGGRGPGAEVETVDLDDLTWDGRAGVYYRSCHRCGAARGYSLTEDDLDAAAGADDDGSADGGGELMVQCTGCSLWLRVLFEEVMDDEDDEAPARTSPTTTVRSNGGGPVQVDAGGLKVSGGSVSGKTASWSFKVNFGISIGGGASASASTQSGR